ncbi:heavy metal-associated isoprenylated plant protein 47-like [Typha latifolia]|uniref:heavy metal-associated isoprenylated plant protein 47-like n=1 Tax=Typha latifolia TaxID=4733 RepID=UPI003C2CE8AB
MKQTIVIKIHTNSDKCRAKAMALAAKAYGVISIELQDEDHLVVVGDGVDAVHLTTTLRKKLCHGAYLTKVEEVKESAEKEAEEEKPEVEQVRWYPNYYTPLPPPWYPNYPPFSQAVVYDSESYSGTSSCSIM